MTTAREHLNNALDLYHENDDHAALGHALRTLSVMLAECEATPPEVSTTDDVHYCGLPRVLARDGKWYCNGCPIQPLAQERDAVGGGVAAADTDVSLCGIAGRRCDCLSPSVISDGPSIDCPVHGIPDKHAEAVERACVVAWLRTAAERTEMRPTWPEGKRSAVFSAYMSAAESISRGAHHEDVAG